MENINFSRNLIRGKIVEVIFEQMIRDEGRYDVIPFGYEYTMPTLAQYQHLVEIREVIKNISDAPDFALISTDKKKVYLVEVKYQSKLDSKNLKRYAEELAKRWTPSWLFIATLEGFYCAPCRSIKKAGAISRLSQNWVTPKRQTEYLNLLSEFEKNKNYS